MELNRHQASHNEPIETSTLRQIIVGLVDVVIAIVLFVLVMTYLVPDELYEIISFINSILLFLVWQAFYRLVCLLVMNGTIGMKLFRVILLNGYLEKLSFVEKLLASCFILYKGVDYYDK
jgi:heme/copper-type cytochrome/quinol oxidase subunit 4